MFQKIDFTIVFLPKEISRNTWQAVSEVVSLQCQSTPKRGTPRPYMNIKRRDIFHPRITLITRMKQEDRDTKTQREYSEMKIRIIRV